MCGIFGAVSQNKNVIPTVIAGIKELEYRGYDSSGIAYINKGKIDVIKQCGKIDRLISVVNEKKPESNLCIAHTRWATHGKPSVVNSHPHLSNNKKIAIVHNGIIENYSELANKFLGNINLVSETDSEVVCHLLQVFDEKNKLIVMQNVCKKIKGSFALAIIFEDESDKIYVAKRFSPIVIGRAKATSYVCSDSLSLKNNCDDIYMLEDDQFAILSSDSIFIYDNDLKDVEPEKLDIEKSKKEGSLEKYPNYMIKEILEQKTSTKKTITNNSDFNKIAKILPKEYIESIEYIFFIACGTAYHAGKIGEYIFADLDIFSSCFVASEFRYKQNEYIPKNSLAIFISQSGETADTIACVKRCKSLGVKTLVITNVEYSSICYLCDYVFYTSCGKEVAVASTKAYTSQLACIYILKKYFDIQKNNLDKKLFSNECKQLKELSNKFGDDNINQLAKKAASKYQHIKKHFVIGRQMDAITSLEAALKIKEVTYSYCEAYPSGELKHGTIALVDTDSLVICFATDKTVLEKNISALQEVKARGAHTMLITFFNVENINEIIDDTIKLEEISQYYSPILSIEFVQFYAYYLALIKGINPDKPRNLAKSVTVE